MLSIFFMFNSFDDRISTTEENITTIDNSVTKTVTDIQGLDGRVATAESNVVGLGSRVQQTEADVGSFDGRIIA